MTCCYLGCEESLEPEEDVGCLDVGLTGGGEGLRAQAGQAGPRHQLKPKTKETWFKLVTVTGRATRSAADPLNLRSQACIPGSQRVVDTRNNIPATLKQAVTVKEFKNGYLQKPPSNIGGRHLDEWSWTG